MKKRVLSLLALAAAFALTACQAADPAQPLDSPGVAPYELSEEGEYLLRAYGLDGDSKAIRYRSPEGANGINVNTYVLSETGEWVENGLGGLFLDGAQPEGELSGTFTLTFQKDGSITLNILGDGTGFQAATDPADLSAYTGKSLGFLQDAEDAEVGEEIPVALIGYTSGNSMEAFDLSDFFTPENLADLDFVQAVTVEFTSESET